MIPGATAKGRAQDRMSRAFSIRAIMAFLVMIISLILAASPAHAQWLKAETDRFVVYSNGAEGELRDYVNQLETFESLLRALHGMNMREAPPRRMELYLVRNHRDMLRVNPNTRETTAGFYSASLDNIFGIAVMGRERNSRSVSRNSRDFIMLHEYVHHFMLQNAPYGYPAWIVEGYAEYFMTARFLPDVVEIGHHQEGRMAAGRNLPLRTLLTSSPGSLGDRDEVFTFYFQAWLLTHYLMSDRDRYQKLQTYLRDVSAGADPADAMEAALGMSLGELQRELADYRRLLITRYPTGPMPTPVITIERLGPSANDLLLEAVQVRYYAARGENERLLNTVRGRAARHPDDLFAQLTLARAEVRLGDQDEGERILRTVLSRDMDNVEALQLLASSLMERAQADAGNAAALNAEARGHLARAYAADPGHYQTLLSIARNGGGRTIPAPEHAAEAYLAALELAPQVSQLRIETAVALLGRDQIDYGAHVLEPLLNSPHSPRVAAYARNLLDAARAGRSLTSVTWDGNEGDADDEEGDGENPEDDEGEETGR